MFTLFLRHVFNGYTHKHKTLVNIKVNSKDLASECVSQLLRKLSKPDELFHVGSVHDILSNLNKFAGELSFENYKFM